ncbi:MAG: DUF4097 family beta strand repeat-containing protein [Clostridiaceae bacterium]
MEKKLKLISITLWSIIAISLSIYLIYVIKNNTGSFKFNQINFGSSSESSKKDYSASLDGVDQIKLDLVSYDVVVYPSDDKELKVIQYSSQEIGEDDKLIISKDGDSLSIKEPNKNFSFSFFNFESFTRKVELYLPKEYVKDLDVNTTSGDIFIDSDITLTSLDSTQVSGDFTSKNINVDDISVISTSGDIEIEDVLTKSYTIKTISGDVNINSISGSGKVGSTSGDIEIEYSDIAEYASLNSVSGDIDIIVPDAISFEFDGNSVSGDIDSDFDLNYKNKNGNKAAIQNGEAPYKKIDASTTSGDINIRK